MYILVADSGSTKTEWWCFSPESNSSCPEILITKGLNPYYHMNESIADVLSEVADTYGASHPDFIFFYGAGCSLPDKQHFVHEAIKRVFPNTAIEVNDDLLGAARAVCGANPGIVAILGTGSNSCFYDGNKIVQNIPSLGFILGDEGSGAFIGKMILRAYFYGELPLEISSHLEAQFDMSRKTVLDRVYRGELPNRYVASFARITQDFSQHPLIKKLITDSFRLFVSSHLMKYPQKSSLSVGFIGSVAFEHQNIMKEVLAEFNLKAGIFLKSPLPKLLEFHSNYHEKSY